MKLLIVRCEDTARASDRLDSLLDGAKMPHLQHLAQAGAAGLIRQGIAQTPLGRFGVHRALLGLGQHDPEAAPGACYAAAIGRQLGEEETAWACELMTQQDGAVFDPAAGGVTTKESAVLIQAVNDRFASDTRRWFTGYGAHHVLITSDRTLRPDRITAIPGPESVLGKPWERALPRTAVGEAVAAIVAETRGALEDHPINRVRLDLGENPANLLWCWGGSGKPGRRFADWAGHSGALVSAYFPMRGLAQVLGMDWAEGPVAFSEQEIRATAATLETLLARAGTVYLHLRVSAADPVQRLCAMERLDQGLLKPLTNRLSTHSPWRLVTIIDDRHQPALPVVAIGTGLPQHPVVHLDARSLAASSLDIADSAALAAWLRQGAG